MSGRTGRPRYRATLPAGVGLGRYMVQTNENLLSLTADVVGNRESFTGDTDSTVEAEGLLQLSYRHRNRRIRRQDMVSPDFLVMFTAV